jgi:hypothetical protein
MSLFYLQQKKNYLTDTFRTYHKTFSLDPQLSSASVTLTSQVGSHAMLLLLIVGNLELRRLCGIIDISFVSSVLKSVKWFKDLSGQERRQTCCEHGGLISIYTYLQKLK